MTLRAPAAVPPTVLLVADEAKTRPVALAIAAVPAALVPIRLPWKAVVVAPTMLAAAIALPPMTLPAPVPGVAVRPPIVVLVPLSMRIPSDELPTAAVPAALVPM